MSYGAASALTLSIMTLRNAAIAERIQAASMAGFSGIGWRLADFEAGSVRDIQHKLADARVRPLEVEFFRAWVGRENEPGYREKEKRLLSLAAWLGARHINTAALEPHPAAEIAASFAGLCQRAAPYGLIVQLEFMPYTPPIDSLRAAWDIVREAGQPNAGLLIDAWHWARANCNGTILKDIPSERITSIQLGDVLPEPMDDVVEEARHHRCVPGAGGMDLSLFLRTLESYGVSAPLSVEIMSDALDSLPAAQAAEAAARGTRAVLRDYSRGS